MRIFRRLYAFLRRVWDWFDSELIYLQTRRHIPAIRQYAYDECGPRKSTAGGATSRRLILGVLGGYPVLGYVRLGYDWLAPYYNPLLMFDEVHYFQSGATRMRILDWGYPLYIHGSMDISKVVQVSRDHSISILRAYDPICGRVAIEAARELDIPAVVSVH